MANKVILTGKLGAEPESRSFPDGGSICNLRVATTERWKDRQTGEKKEHTEWHRVVLRNRVGEVAQQYTHKGSTVYIEGSIRTRKWQDQNGQDRYSTEIMGDRLELLDSKPAQSQQAPPAAAAPPPVHNAAPTGTDYLDDDIPF